VNGGNCDCVFSCYIAGVTPHFSLSLSQSIQQQSFQQNLKHSFRVMCHDRIQRMGNFCERKMVTCTVVILFFAAVASKSLILESCWGKYLATGVTPRYQLYCTALEYNKQPRRTQFRSHSLPVLSEIPIPEAFTAHPPRSITPYYQSFSYP